MCAERSLGRRLRRALPSLGRSRQSGTLSARPQYAETYAVAGTDTTDALAGGDRQAGPIRIRRGARPTESTVTNRQLAHFPSKIQIQVYDYDSLGSDDLLGRGRVPAWSCLGREATHQPQAMVLLC